VSGNRKRAVYHEAGHCAAIAFGIPIVHVTIEAAAGHLYRGHYRERADLALECIVTMCLAGPAAEELFCGPIRLASNSVDISNSAISMDSSSRARSILVISSSVTSTATFG
jgi:hypothetical protein